MKFINNLPQLEILETLERETRKMENLLKLAEMYWSDLQSRRSSSRPFGYIDGIENVQTADDVALERRRFTEALLQYGSLIWAYHAARGDYMTHRQKLVETVKAVLNACNDEEFLRYNRSIRQAARSNCIFADRLCSIEVGDAMLKDYQDVQGDRGFGALLRKVSQAEFDALCVRIKEVKTPEHRFELTESVGSMYPLSVLVTADALGQRSGRFPVEMRNIAIVAYDDTRNESHPAIVCLREKLVQCATLLEIAKARFDHYNQNAKGRVNEKQHADRLMNVLFEYDDETALKTIQGAAEKQSELRCDYHSARLATQVAITEAELARREVLLSLVTAVEQTRALSHHVQTESIVTVDFHRAHSQAMLLCLHADVLLRSGGRDLQRFSAVFGEDLSDGAAERSFDKLVDGLHTHYLSK